MGKGDIKSRRGKIINGSYGVRRRRKKKTISAGVIPEKEKVKREVAQPVKKAETVAEKSPQVEKPKPKVKQAPDAPAKEKPSEKPNAAVSKARTQKTTKPKNTPEEE